MSKRSFPKSMSRSTARLAAVQACYSIELTGQPAIEAVPEHVGRRFAGLLDGEEIPPIETPFFEKLVLGEAGERKIVDDMLANALGQKNPLEGLEIVLRAILRLGAFELLSLEDVPAKVAIAEYVRMTEDYFTGSEPGLVNAVLDRVARTLRPDEFETKD